MSQLYLPHGTENIFFKRRKIRKETKNKNRLCSEEMVRNMKIIQDMYNSPHLYKTKIQMQKNLGRQCLPLPLIKSAYALFPHTSLISLVALNIDGKIKAKTS